MGSISGASKTQRGGFRQSVKTQQRTFFNESYLDGSVNFFEDIDQYLTISAQLDVGKGSFFLGINRKVATTRAFFRLQARERNTFGTIAKFVFQAEICRYLG